MKITSQAFTEGGKIPDKYTMYGDNVIPPSETAWLAQEVPARWLRAKLISPAISHVELDARSSDRFALVNWMAALLAEAAASPQGRIPPAW